MSPAYPSLYQVNTRVLLTALSRTLGRPATLDDIPDAELDRIAGLGFDYVWLLSVWRTGSAGQRVSSAHAGWRHEFEDTLPDLCAEDIAGSGFAITGYTAHPAVGGTAALARTRRRLQARGLKLMLDFVPNHTALDHPWVEDHPDYYVGAGELEPTRAPQNYTWVKRMRGDVLLAHGRDPYFDGWPDTLQLDYANPATQEAMIGELLVIAEQCDAVRCDMAMLVLPKIFERTWGRRPPPFWAQAIQRVRKQVSGGLRLRLRQAPLRPAARGTRAARARAPVGGSRRPESARAVHGEPRRAQGRPDVCVGDARGRGTSVSRRTWFALRRHLRSRRRPTSSRAASFWTFRRGATTSSS